MVVSSIVPGLAVETEPGVVMLRMAEDGHFYARTESRTASTIRMLVDTGASSIALSAEDARRIGFDPVLAGLQPAHLHGQRYEASPHLSVSARCGSARFTVNDVRAGVLQPGMVEGSLLGMTFLGRLSGFGFEDDRLIMRR